MASCSRKLILCFLVGICQAQTPETDLHVSFRVRYVASGSVYVDGGRAAGLAEGTMLVIEQSPSAGASGTTTPKSETPDPAAQGIVAQLKVVSVASTSAVCEVVKASREIVVGDIATLPESEVQQLVTKRALSSTRQYPAVASFTTGDPMDEEVRALVPRPPLPEVNRATGRIGFDFSSTTGNIHSSEIGLVLRADVTRIAETHWNLNGYWRGRIDSLTPKAQPTIQDALNRTYHLGLTYANPDSRWNIGIGRMYIPWASSLQTIDGAYLARRLSHTATAGIFAGSSPDPTSWSYNPNRRLGGTFLNFSGGSYDSLRYSSTFGGGVNTLGWQIDRPFGFIENEWSYRRVFSLFHSLQMDRPNTTLPIAPVGVGVGSSYLTLRFQPHRRATFDFNHTYFRDLPTFDAQLIGTGLLDKLLFQGFSGGVRVELPDQYMIYTNIGRSNKTGDAKGSWNTMFGLTKSRIWRTGIRADLRYGKFDTMFAQGSYESIAFSRNLTDTLRCDVQLGRQSFSSPAIHSSGANFFNSHFDAALGARYFTEGGFTAQRGSGSQSYNQWYATFGYRFDNRSYRKGSVNAPQK